MANLNARLLLAVHQFEARDIRAALLNIDQIRLAVSRDGFLQKALRGLPIVCNREGKVEGLALLIYSAIIVFSPPAWPDSFLLVPKCGIEL